MRPRAALVLAPLLACREPAPDDDPVDGTSGGEIGSTGDMAGEEGEQSGSASGSTTGEDEDPLSDPLALPELIDNNPDPDVVEVTIIAGPSETAYLDGKPASVLAYRDGSDPDAVGTVPGPLLRAKQGDHVIIHFQSELDVETTIHWHGIRPPNEFDGTPASQVPVPAGGSFDYAWDARDAGTFWFHPHVDGEVQIEAGLYAPIIVEEGDNPAVTIDRVLFLDDVKLESDGSLSERTDPLDLMMGRQGNVVLTSGVKEPRAPTLAGGVERWRILNAANGRFFNLELPGHEFLVIAWDGGRLPTPYATDRLLVVPGERYEVLVKIDAAVGDQLTLSTLHYDRGHNLPDPGPKTLLRLDVVGETQMKMPSEDELGGPFAPLVTDSSTPRRAFVLTEEEEGLEEPIFMINGAAFPEHTPIAGLSGAVEIWEVRNDSEMDHPFHLHGMFFQVLDGPGTAAAHAGWKDTVNVPMQTTTTFAVALGEPGMWMYHCHILEHAERGMMGELMITP
jgi:FtsP/CotA-like multicopper oxidase with cupredoxin domain